MSDAQARITGDSMPDRRQREDTAAIRVSNLSENVQEADLQVFTGRAGLGSILIIVSTGTLQTLRKHCKNFPCERQGYWSM